MHTTRTQHMSKERRKRLASVAASVLQFETHADTITAQTVNTAQQETERVALIKHGIRKF